MATVEAKPKASTRARKKPRKSATPKRRAAVEANAESRNPPDPAKVKAKIQSLTKQHGKKPWDVTFDVYLQRPGSNPPATVQTCLEMDSGKRIRFRNRRRPGFVIRFRLHDELNPGYRFPSDATDAVWSHAANKCPTTPVWDVFKPIGVDSTGTELEVFNENPRPAIGKFKYTLRVFKNGAPLDIDPPGDNQNGTYS